MLLADLLHSAGVISPDEVTGIVPVDLTTIAQFQLGDHYWIMRTSGKTHEVSDLETILGVIRDEFALWERQLVPVVEVKTITKYGKPDKVTFLLVVPKRLTPFSLLPAPDIDAFVDLLRQRVVWYNLSGSWDYQPQGSNL